MSDEINREDDLPMEEEENFAEMLEAYADGMNEDIRIGDKVSGRIISIGADTVYIDTGTKTDGVVDKAELLDENGELPFGEGDTIDLFVVAMDESEIRLSRALSGVGGDHMLQEAYDGKVPVEGKVKATCKGGFHVEIMKRRAFCPVSQIDLGYTEDMDVHVGQTYDFVITRLEGGGRNIVVSRKKLLQKAAEKEKKAFLENLKVGDTCDGTVTRILPFGAFVTLAPGLEGMVHISELSWSHVADPKEAVTEGEPVTVQVISIEKGKDARSPKIGLSIRRSTADPWDSVEENFTVGQKVTGKVTKLAKFGAFVEIAPGIEGLVHISEMSYLRRILDPSEVVKNGESVPVMVKDIDTDKRRLSLSIKDAEGDPWADVDSRFATGQAVEGRVEKREAFGIFIQLAPGITGLLPKINIAKAESPGAFENAKPGDTLVVAIERIDAAKRRISLAPAEQTGTDNWQSYTGQKESAPQMSDLAMKLQQALNKKQ